MRRTMIAAMALLLWVGLPANAQKKMQKEPVGKRVSKFWKKTRDQMVEAGHDLGDALGFEDRVSADSDLKEIDGVKYMPLYTTDLFAKTDAATDARLIGIATREFGKKYPKAEIVSAVIPQEDWLATAVKTKKKISGYCQRAYCYILAKDGNDGYINARFLFMTYRNPGEEAVQVNWPEWERTDIVPAGVYLKLK